MPIKSLAPPIPNGLSLEVPWGTRRHPEKSPEKRPVKTLFLEILDPRFP